MVTVSELKWHQTIPIGKCPCCGKEKPLGILNIPWYDEEDEQRGPRCIDCFFGPPEPDFTPFDEDYDEGRDEEEIINDIIREQIEECLK